MIKTAIGRLDIPPTKYSTEKDPLKVEQTMETIMITDNYAGDGITVMLMIITDPWIYADADADADAVADDDDDDDYAGDEYYVTGAPLPRGRPPPQGPPHQSHIV